MAQHYDHPSAKPARQCGASANPSHHCRQQENRKQAYALVFVDPGGLGHGALRFFIVQSSMCAYLAWIALGGLLLNALFKFSWADPAAALLLLPIAGKSGLPGHGI